MRSVIASFSSSTYSVSSDLFFLYRRRSRCQSVLHVCGAQSPLDPPPATYRLKDDAYAISRRIVSESFPSLLDLVEDGHALNELTDVSFAIGSLVVHQWRRDYEERRDDGYREPKWIFLLGTCHLSLKSAQDVERLIKTVQPENVVVELCKSRTATLYDPSEDQPGPNPFSLSGGSYSEALLRTMRLGGIGAFIFRLLMGTLAQRIGRSFERQSGAEMRAAQRASEQTNATVVLGDRPIEITLKLAASSLSLGQKWKFLKGLITGLWVSDNELVSEVRTMRNEIDNVNEDLIDLWTRKLTDQFPELASPLIHERDLYLAWSMKRSKAVNGSQTVVGVIGRGHLRGTYYAIQHDTGTLRFKDLVGQSSQSKSEMLIAFSQRLAVDVVIGIACYFAWAAVVHSTVIDGSIEWYMPQR